MIGVAVAARQSATSRSHIAGSVPKSTPPETFGQEMFSSIAATPARPSSRAVICTNSSCVRPAMLTMIGTPSAAEVRQVMRDERLDAVVVEADRVEHAGGRLDRPPRRVAGPRLLRDRLRQDAAEAADVDQAFHLAGIAKRARGDQDRIRQPQPAELNGEIDRSCRLKRHDSRESQRPASDANESVAIMILNCTALQSATIAAIREASGAIWRCGRFESLASDRLGELALRRG